MAFTHWQTLHNPVTYDNTLGYTPPDTLRLTILIPRERGRVNYPGHKHNKSPYS